MRTPSTFNDVRHDVVLRVGGCRGVERGSVLDTHTAHSKHALRRDAAVSSHLSHLETL